MAKQGYSLNTGEMIVFKIENVRHGFFGGYTNVLLITNQGLVLEEFGLFNNYKGYKKIANCEICQAVIGSSSNGEKQLEVYVKGGKKEEFVPQTFKKKGISIFCMAINDPNNKESEVYNYQYYEELWKANENEKRRVKTERKIEKLRQEKELAMQYMNEPIIENESVNIDFDFQKGINFAGNVAKSMIKSGDISMKGLVKGVSKASKKQVTENIFGGVIEEILDDFGIRDIQDEFIELGNDLFREPLGLKPKLTYEERSELAERERRIAAAKQREINKRKNVRSVEEIDRLIKKEEDFLRTFNKKSNYNTTKVTYTYKVKNKQSAASAGSKYVASKRMTDNLNATHAQFSRNIQSINDQLDVLKKLKELLDIGVITQGEFDRKKTEILNL